VGRHHPGGCAPSSGGQPRAKERKIGLYMRRRLPASVERWALNARNVYVASQIKTPTSLLRDGQRRR
jgi:hypothetical protein